MAKWAASWWPSGKTALWVSPYVRTCQTASYLEKYLPIEQFHTHKAIASGDLVAVYDEILSRETADVVCGRIGSASLLFYAHPKALKFLGPSYKE